MPAYCRSETLPRVPRSTPRPERFARPGRNALPRSQGARRPRAGLETIDGAEFDPAIERVAQVVGAEADQGFARADAIRSEPRREPLVLPFEALFDDRGAALRQRLVGGSGAGAAGVADDLHAGLAAAG